MQHQRARWRVGPFLALSIALALARPVAAQVPLDPTTIPKYQAELVIPPVMPPSGKLRVPGERLADY
jgi:hypothetical protein